VYPYATIGSIRLPENGREIDVLEMGDMEQEVPAPTPKPPYTRGFYCYRQHPAYEVEGTDPFRRETPVRMGQTPRGDAGKGVSS
jgi:hypothetical protein